MMKMGVFWWFMVFCACNCHVFAGRRRRRRKPTHSDLLSEVKPLLTVDQKLTCESNIVRSACKAMGHDETWVSSHALAVSFSARADYVNENFVEDWFKSLNLKNE